MKRPNVVIVLMDGCRADRLGAYGYKMRANSKYLDSCAENGVVARNNYSTSNCTMPAVISMMTGMYPACHKAATTSAYYEGSYPFLTTILKDEGYYTFGITNNLVGMSPEWGFVRGYDKYYRIGKNNNWFRESKEEQRGLEKVSIDTMIKRAIMKGLHAVLPPAQKFLEKKTLLKYYFQNDMGGGRAVETFGLGLRERDGGKPFFCYINLPETHAPYFAPRKYYNPSYNLMKAILKPLEFLQSGAELSQHDQEHLSYMYDSCVEYIDFLCHQIEEQLVAQGLLDNTLLIFTSDHGGMLGERFQWVGGRYHLFEAEIKTACILKGPEIKQQTTDKLTSSIDLFPTIMEYLEIPYKYNINGLSIFSKSGHDSILIDTPAIHESLRALFQHKNLQNLIFDGKALISESGMKCIFENGQLSYLFDLKSDPQEKKNLATNAKSRKYEDAVLKKYQSINASRKIDEYPYNDIADLPQIDKINPGFDPACLIYV